MMKLQRKSGKDLADVILCICSDGCQSERSKHSLTAASSEEVDVLIDFYSFYKVTRHYKKRDRH